MKKIAVLILLMFGSVMFRADVTSAVEEIVDGIVAVVGNEIILLSELQKQVNSQMMARNLDINRTPRNVLIDLRDEIIQGMVDDRLLFEKARRDSIEIDARDVDLELKDNLDALKRQYGSEEEYRKGLEEYGLTEVQLKNMYRNAIEKDFILQRIRFDMSRHISVTPQDMEAWITANKDSLPVLPERFKLSHILMYPRVSEEKQEKVKENLRGILNRIRAGEDFGELARQYSEDPGTADKGGFIDYFSRDDGFDPDFTRAAFSLQKGEVSDIVETVFGYHIIKVEDILGDRIQARHILIRVVPDEEDEMQIANQLKEIREDIVSGETTFEDMAKQYSDDENSRDLGGKLDWITSERGMSDSGIPSFILHAKEMEIGEISEPFKSQFGYHIIKLDDHKPAHTINIRDDRTILEPLIKQKKFIEEYERIIRQLRQETYISIRLN